jgi:uncharacterized protein YceH (UPF0502 family)
MRPLTPIETRVLGTLMEKARTVPDSYPLSLNALVSGCNQKSAREPAMEVTDAQAQEALDELKRLALVFEFQRQPRHALGAQRRAGAGHPQPVDRTAGLVDAAGPTDRG